MNKSPQIRRILMINQLVVDHFWFLICLFLCFHVHQESFNKNFNQITSPLIRGATPKFDPERLLRVGLFRKKDKFGVFAQKIIIVCVVSGWHAKLWV